jgi:hypothetical protein
MNDPYFDGESNEQPKPPTPTQAQLMRAVAETLLRHEKNLFKLNSAFIALQGMLIRLFPNVDIQGMFNEFLVNVQSNEGADVQKELIDIIERAALDNSPPSD